MPIDAYIHSLSERCAAGGATEHTHRPALQNLLQALLPDLTVMNEPAKRDCGMPDFALLRKNQELYHIGVPIAYIEAKDIQSGDLDGKGKNKEQFDRYKGALDNIVFTDYLDFVFYRRGVRLGNVTIGEVRGEIGDKGKGRAIRPLKANYDEFRRMVQDLGTLKPQRIASGRALAEIMAGKARLMAVVLEKLLDAGDRDLAGQIALFRTVLIPDMTNREFASVYAQTITYGLFAARIHDKEETGFCRERAARLIPPTNPFLRRLFQAIANYDANAALALIVDDLAEAYGAADVKEIVGGSDADGADGRDPVIHFYENFLASFDPEERRRKGVYYTPKPIVNFIVRAVDEILQRDFGIKSGIADQYVIRYWKGKDRPRGVPDDVWARMGGDPCAPLEPREEYEDPFAEEAAQVDPLDFEANRDLNIRRDRYLRAFVKKKMEERWASYHRVQILDPAVGTGAFLAEAIGQIHQKMKGQRGVWRDYVRNSLLPRLSGFELLMAPYTLAHTMLEWQLSHYTKGEGPLTPDGAIDAHNGAWARKYGKAKGKVIYGHRDLYWGDEAPLPGVRPKPKPSKVAKAAKITKAAAPSGQSGQDGKTAWSQSFQEAVAKAYADLYADVTSGPPSIDILDRETAVRTARRQQRQNAPYVPQEDERLRVFLTNSLDLPKPHELNPSFMEWFFEEARGATAIKALAPIMVVMGNPPYSAESKNKGEWITALMDDYKKEPGTGGRLEERNSKWINDDYVKFMRLGQHLIDRSGEGIVAYITNHGFLDNPTFRGMRYSLLNSFDRIYIIDLHGNAKKKETAPDGGRDENVFDIQQGVSINIFVKLPAKDGRPAPKDKDGGGMAEVHHFDVYGTREHKFDFLLTHALLETRANQRLPAVPFARLHPAGLEYFFVPKDYRGKKTYDKGFSVADLFPVNSAGIATARDAFTIHGSPGAVEGAIRGFLSLSDEEAREKYDLGKDVRDWTVAGAREDLLTAKGRIVEIAYRPFDTRYTRYSGVDCGFHCRPRREVMRHFLHGGNVGLSACRQFKTGDEYCHVLVSENMIESGYVSNRTSEITYLFPLYLYPDDDGSKERTPNLDTETVEKISSTAGLAFEAEKSRKRGAFSPMDLLDYVYAALHNPGYREKYAEFLKTDFPKVPYPKNANELWAYAKLGARLRKLHLLEPDAIGTIKTRFPIDSHLEGLVDRPRWEQRDESGSLGRVWLNADQYFDRVPLAAWEMRIGGYRPAQKWLKDRQGTRLDYAAIEHYQKIVAAMEKTHETMEELRGM